MYMRICIFLSTYLFILDLRRSASLYLSNSSNPHYYEKVFKTDLKLTVRGNRVPLMNTSARKELWIIFRWIENPLAW